MNSQGQAGMASPQLEGVSRGAFSIQSGVVFMSEVAPPSLTAAERKKQMDTNNGQKDLTPL
jgi:hypothetical protein